MAGIKVTCPWTMFTRNSLDHDLDLACKMAKDGVQVIHGCKTQEQYEAIMNALESEMSLVP